MGNWKVKWIKFLIHWKGTPKSEALSEGVGEGEGGCCLSASQIEPISTRVSYGQHLSSLSDLHNNIGVVGTWMGCLRLKSHALIGKEHDLDNKDLDVRKHGELMHHMNKTLIAWDF
ncbi:hypothetical protein CK203_053823 [Vitis vinifera]|uniref:Uncharacterized protein n=1 Tax=Vitis vinifera TaxID=29760 RepID=A0A438GRJ0_VITVI|nr:hypothetical protein CK203_053823 [Vitis vinifera]